MRGGFWPAVGLAALLMAATLQAEEEGATAPAQVLRLALTPVVLNQQQHINAQLAAYLQARLGRKVEVVQRQSYQQIIDLMTTGRVDAAWICGLPYVRNRSWLELLAVPLNRFNQGRALYRSLLISGKQGVKTLEDLRDGVFAFADPDSNSGHLVPEYLLFRRGMHAADYFRAHFFTNSHRDVVRAVGDGLADGGSVDSYIFHALEKSEPQLTAKVRVIAESDEFAFPPIVVRRVMAAADKSALRRAFLDMDRDQAGRSLLDSLHLDGFIAGNTAMFDAIAHMDAAVFARLAHR